MEFSLIEIHDFNVSAENFPNDDDSIHTQFSEGMLFFIQVTPNILGYIFGSVKLIQ
jgi:hypothetical protein